MIAINKVCALSLTVAAQLVAATAHADGFKPGVENKEGSISVLSRDAAQAKIAELRDYLPKIIGGIDAKPSEFPHQVSLMFAGDEPGVDRHFCGGSVVANDAVLTAAHCLSWVVGYTDFIRVGAGSIDLDLLTEHEISGIWLHPSYNESTLDFDFAIIKTRTPFFDPAVKIINPDENQLIGVGHPATITGWGLDSNGDIQKILKKTEVNVVGRSECNGPGSYDGLVSARMICLAAAGKDSCQGDSGGPATAIIEDSQEPVLFGSTSWGFGCAEPDYPGVYGRVISVHGWIQDILDD